MASIGFVPELGEEDAIGADIEGLRGGPGTTACPAVRATTGSTAGREATTSAADGLRHVSYVDRTVGVAAGARPGSSTRSTTTSKASSAVQATIA